MLTEATKRAREADETFAAESGAKVGDIQTANQGIVEVHPAERQRPPGHDPAEREHGDLCPPAAEHDHHAPPGVVDREPNPEGGGDVGLDQLDGPPPTGLLGRLLHRPLLHRAEPRRHDHQQLRPGPPAGVHLEQHVAQHPGADVDVGDHAVLHRPDHLDRRRRAAQHAAGLAAHGHRPPVLRRQGDEGGLLEDDPAPGDEHGGRARSQIDGRVATLQAPALRLPSARGQTE